MTIASQGRLIRPLHLHYITRSCQIPMYLMHSTFTSFDYSSMRTPREARFPTLHQLPCRSDCEERRLDTETLRGANNLLVDDSSFSSSSPSPSPFRVGTGLSSRTSSMAITNTIIGNAAKVAVTLNIFITST